MRKKGLAVILAAAVFFSLAACGQKKEADSSAGNSTLIQEADAAEAAGESNAAGDASEKTDEKKTDEEKESSGGIASLKEDSAEKTGITMSVSNTAGTSEFAREDGSTAESGSEEAAEGGTAAEETAAETPDPFGITAGGWTRAESPVVTDEVKALLEKAVKDMSGAQYTPVAYLASQVVSGTNHAILCRIAPVVPEPKEKYGIVYLYEDLNGNAGIIEVKDFEAETNINDLDGGWAQAETPVITEDAGAAFDKAMKNLVGVDYTPVALLSTQVVSGTNYCFLCEATVVYPGAETSYALVYIYADLEGNAEITQIVNIAE